MNLQRTLFFISNEINYESLEIQGFDLFTSVKKKNDWYNQQAIRIMSTDRENTIYTVMRHDYLLNIIFTKKIVKLMTKVKGDFSTFIESFSVAELFEAFKRNI